MAEAPGGCYAERVPGVRPTPTSRETPFRQRLRRFGEQAWRQGRTIAINQLRPLATRLPPATKARLRSWLGLSQPGDYLSPGSEASRVIAARSAGERPAGRRGKPGVNIVGYLRSELGIGEAARLCALSAQSVELPFALIDFSAGSANRARDERWKAQISRSNPYAVNLVYINADELPRAYEYFGRDFFESRYNVGVWHWELPEFPERWRPSFKLVDEIWAPTRFIRDALAAHAPVPVLHMPHAVSFDPPAAPRRSRFSLPDDAFLFLTMYDMRSSQERKNPQAVVEAFQRAFPASALRAGTVGLVVKIMNAGTDPNEYASLHKAIAEAPGIFPIDETLSREDVYGLQATCDAFISLHRSEGFGLGLAESMLLGKPVIATNWSGNVDFMNSENSCPVEFELIEIDRDHGPYRRGQRWASPDIEHAAKFMQLLVADPALCARIGAAGKNTIELNHSPQLIGERYRERLKEITVLR